MPGFNIGGGGGSQDPSATIETARKHRWKLTVFDTLNSILIYAHKCQRPHIEIAKVTIHHGQNELKFPGKDVWGPIEITFYQATDPNVAKTIYDWRENSVVSVQNSKINLTKKSCTLEMTDGNDKTIWKYQMYGCWPTKITPDELDYSSSAISEITFTLEMDKAKETSG